jgi:hypothetical protein
MLSVMLAKCIAAEAAPAIDKAFAPLARRNDRAIEWGLEIA